MSQDEVEQGGLMAYVVIGVVLGGVVGFLGTVVVNTFLRVKRIEKKLDYLLLDEWT